MKHYPWSTGGQGIVILVENKWEEALLSLDQLRQGVRFCFALATQAAGTGTPGTRLGGEHFDKPDKMVSQGECRKDAQLTSFM